jgi:hypothetical protein
MDSSAKACTVGLSSTRRNESKFKANAFHS